MRLWRVLLGGLGLLMALFLWLPIGHADIPGVAVTPLLTDAQTDRWQVPLGQHRSVTLAINLVNEGQAPVHLRIFGRDAGVALNGQWDYSGQFGRPQGALPSLKTLVTPVSVTLPAQTSSTRRVTLDATAPTFRGQLQGAIVVSPSPVSTADGDQWVAIPVTLQGTTPMPPAKWQVTHLSPSVANSQPQLVVTVNQPAPTLVKSVKLDMTVTRRAPISLFGLGDQHWHIRQTIARVPGNTTIPVAVPLQGQAIKAGRYVVTGTATVGSQQQALNKQLTLSQGLVDDVNSSADHVIWDETNWLILAAIGLLGLIVGVSWWGFRSSRRS